MAYKTKNKIPLSKKPRESKKMKIQIFQTTKEIIFCVLIILVGLLAFKCINPIYSTNLLLLIIYYFVYPILLFFVILISLKYLKVFRDYEFKDQIIITLYSLLPLGFVFELIKSYRTDYQANFPNFVLISLTTIIFVTLYIIAGKFFIKKILK